MSPFSLVSGLAALSFGALSASAYDPSRTDNLAVYWGQNSYGATHSGDTANYQKNLSHYCQDDTIDAIPMAFVNVFFGAGGLPSLDLSNVCNVVDSPVFPGTNLPNCTFLAEDIKTCQSKGKIVTLSLGGATGAAGFASADQATAFGDTIWNVFLGGKNDTRPFGDAELDGIDLDIEGGSTQYFDSFVKRVRDLANAANKKVYVTGAPQCAFPDAYMSTVLNSAEFDAVYVQFYNNFCSLPNFNNPNAWNFDQWDGWAKNTSLNKDVKIFIGAPASSSAAGSGYVDAATLASIASETRSKYSSFGGIMLWDASQAYANNRFDKAVKAALGQGSSPSPSSASASGKPSAASSVKSAQSAKFTYVKINAAESCANIFPWVANVAYNGSEKVIHNGRLFTAKQWTSGSTPGRAGSDWRDNGECGSFTSAIPTQTSAFVSAESSAPTTTQ
uniref:chitinase n=1 Tax=Ganoderma boninense TaxID=34458 RepID=A0A5K1JTA5_9APHY|nr:Endochitinase 2 (EC (Chitinase 2) [Ganoderma boninense]